MRLVQTKPRFKCDFCSKVATEPTIAKHEGYCFYNPNRYCDQCDNTGTTPGDGYSHADEDCWCCRQVSEHVFYKKDVVKDPSKCPFNHTNGICVSDGCIERLPLISKTLLAFAIKNSWQTKYAGKF